MEPHARRTLRRRLLRWYRASARRLPWRETRDPYAILVSEVMLQQTQVARVLPAYSSFLRRFPTLETLARASLGDVLRAWAGLGYNRRAQHLHNIARSANGTLPRDAARLDALPGIGAYTAGAVACFAHGARGPFADTNVRRVLGRIVLGRVATEAEAVAIDAELMPRDAAPWHHALMDLGATVCVSRAPRCARCPMQRSCRGCQEMTHASTGGTARAPRATRDTKELGQPFATSDRRVRGLIITLLRERDLTAVELGGALDDDRVSSLVDRLVAEGLLERRGEYIGLPA
ncbi:MAG TPA: A/G-specific adenine glycosylase [Candidatus Limnocylindrales bacterium]|nr:A/G-specific adenine glycosylase [Candidatus Limnocylindrales bacterium]